MITSRSRRGSANITPLLMIVSFLVMAGFLVWLGANAEGTETVAFNDPNEGDNLPDSLELAAEMVAIEALEQDPAAYVDQLVRFDGVVAQGLGPLTFFVQLTNNPFLVRLGDSLASAGESAPAQGAELNLIGTVRERTAEVLEAWQAEGSIPEGQMPIVEFSTHYLDVERIENKGTAPMAPDGM